MSTPPPPGIPQSWPEIFRQDADKFPKTFRGIQQFAAQFPPGRPLFVLSSILHNANEALTEALVLLGPDVCPPYFELCRPFFLETLADYRPANLQARALQELAAFTVFAMVLGAEMEEAMSAKLRQGLQTCAPTATTLEEDTQITLALAAIALHAEEHTTEFLAGRANPTEFRPGQVFQFNTPALIQYLVAAIAAAASVDAVLPAWDDFLVAFPYKRAAQTLAWADLLLVAYIMGDRFMGQTPVQTGVWLQETIRQLIGEP